jgi:phage gp36-like protein
MAYNTSATVGVRFGASNVVKWSDLAGAGAVDQARVDASVAWANAEIDSRLTGGAYALPLIGMDAATALVVQDWADILAASWLYFSRGLLDKDEQGEKMTDLREQVFADIKATREGHRRLNARRRWAPNPNAPTAM